MSRKHTHYDASFKSKVVLDLLESGDTLTEVASRHNIIPKNLMNWKKQFIDNMSIAFDKTRVVDSYKSEITSLRNKNDLYAKTLGRVTVERNWAILSA